MPDDTLTLTIRLYDPQEKKDATKSACWAVVKVARVDLEMPAAQFIQKYIQPNLGSLKQLKLT
jgi:hypothetical protein